MAEYVPHQVMPLRKVLAGLRLLDHPHCARTARASPAETPGVIDQTTWTVWIKRVVLNVRVGASPNTQLTVSGPTAAPVGVVLKTAAGQQLAQTGQIQLDGDLPRWRISPA